MKTTQEKEKIAKDKEVQKATAETIERVTNRSFVKVKKLTGELVRVYSLEVHGKEFEKLAREFAKKNAFVAV